MSERISEERLKQIKERCEKATPGPWCWESVAEKSNEFVVGVAFDAAEIPFEGCINGKDYDEESAAWIEDSIIRKYEVGSNEGGSANFGDADFIAHARTDIPDLLAALTERDQLVREMAELLNDFQSDGICDCAGGMKGCKYCNSAILLYRNPLVQSILKGE